MDRIRELRGAKNFTEADEVGEAAMCKHPNDTALLAEHAETAVRRKSWGNAIKRYKRIIQLTKKSPDQDDAVLRLVAVYIALGQPAEAGALLKKAFAGGSRSLALRKAEAELQLLDPEKRFDPGCWRALAVSPELTAADGATRVPVVAACVAGLRLAGHANEAADLLGKHFRPKDRFWEELKDGYSRLVVFDNGRTRVEFYTKIFDAATGAAVVADQLAITFDVMEQTWDKEPFAYRPLSPGRTDFLAVRKRTKDDFHQEMRRDDFTAFALPIAAGYPDVVALGQSLGAYSALYYASNVPGCRILATAPRNPLHPRYAGKRYASYKLFTHEYEMPQNGGIRPTIVYDPKNSEDGRYVEKSLTASFPGAVLVPYPYCGHSITRYLRDVGTLKNATLGFCKGDAFPQFDRSKRALSSEYLRNLAKLNLRAGHAGRARGLALKAQALGTELERTRELLGKIDLTLGGNKAASKTRPGDLS